MQYIFVFYSLIIEVPIKNANNLFRTEIIKRYRTDNIGGGLKTMRVVHRDDSTCKDEFSIYEKQKSKELRFLLLTLEVHYTCSNGLILKCFSKLPMISLWICSAHRLLDFLLGGGVKGEECIDTFSLCFVWYLWLFIDTIL